MCFRLRNGLLKISSRVMAKRIKVDQHLVSNDINEPVVESRCSSSRTSSFTVGSNTYQFARLDPPSKSQSDLKEYSVIKLPNGLTALIISDKSQSNVCNSEKLSECSISESSISENESSCDEEEEDNMSADEGEVGPKSDRIDEKLAACSLSIGVGSFSDPENIPGLAHFLEHMIFMGSEKYPKENEFDVYIKKKGGSDNASTECEYTTFYFDCHEEHLKGAMEIFSHLFIAPLMKRESMTKEREAIESEFQMSIPSDESRRSQLLCSFADTSNPVHKFMWGNLITLRDNIKDDELYEAVHEFRKRHYSANRMTLAVQARLPLNILENWVCECFQNVPDNGLPKDLFTVKNTPFLPDKLKKIYIIEPVKDINRLVLTWVVPPTITMYKAKPLNYISWVVGHEGKGSLLSYLRKKLWCFGITVSGGGDGTEENSIYSLLSISLTLTKEGTEHVEEILNSVFEYIKMFQSKGPQERIFQEIQLVTDTAFRFSEEIPSADNVEQLSEDMQFYPSEDYITGSELFFEYKPHLIKTYLDELNADNVNIMILSKTLASSENLNEIEKWYGTKYHAKHIPPEWTESWKRETVDTVFHLPENNPFIPSDFTILPKPDIPNEYPTLVSKDEILELWYKQDTVFNLPNAFCCLQLVSPLSRQTPQHAAMIDLMISILKQILTEDLYPAMVAQLEYSFHSGEKGIVIVVNGFNEKLKILLQTIIQGIVSFNENLDTQMFLTMKDELKRSYSNSNLKTGFLARELRMSILLNTYWTALDKEKALNDITCDIFKNFISLYFKNLYIQCLIQGNISKEEAIDYGELVKSGLKYNPLSLDTAPEIRVHQLPKGERYCIVNSFNIEDSNSVVTNYYQSGLGTIQESCIIELLLMIMEEPMFDTLRTKQQLGYDVSCTLRDTFGILGFSVSVHCQSDRNSAELVETRITEFLIEFLHTLKNTPPEEFREVQDSLIKLKKCTDVHLKEEVKRNWGEIKNGEYVFNRNNKEREFIEKLTLQELVNWFEVTAGIYDVLKLKKLSTQVVGQKSKANGVKSNGETVLETKTKSNDLSFFPQQETSEKFIFDIKEFKENLHLYPAHKIV